MATKTNGPQSRIQFFGQRGLLFDDGWVVHHTSRRLELTRYCLLILQKQTTYYHLQIRLSLRRNSFRDALSPYKNVAINYPTSTTKSTLLGSKQPFVSSRNTHTPSAISTSNLATSS